ncbi:hypothetical protein DFJ74DRAFT_659626 [Hyaloraphidium curvatum]|nr:hypothetical protein DFJ74DRAFT_659626 [Hyaloraphidium curvatum]
MLRPAWSLVLAVAALLALLYAFAAAGVGKPGAERTDPRTASSRADVAPPANSGAERTETGGAFSGAAPPRTSGPAPGSVEFLYSREGMQHSAPASLDPDGLAPATREVQALLYAHQFRPAEECARATFVVAHIVSGIGSDWHQTGRVLGVAVETGAIMVFSPAHGHMWARGAFCDGTPRNWLCYLREPTNCTAWMKAGNTAKLDALKDKAGMTGWNPSIPAAARKAVQRVRPDMQGSSLTYWWRAQSAAFIARFNDRTIDALREIRMRPNMTMTHGKLPPSPLFPLPPGTIGAHVRLGDKGSEMTLVEYPVFAETAVRLQKENVLGLRPALFVSSEQPKVIKEAATLPPGFETYHSDIPRVGFNGQGHLNKGDEHTLYYLGQLLMALECDAWVGTRGSNWNRLIDELRCIWVAKCRSPYVEVGVEGKDLDNVRGA